MGPAYLGALDSGAIVLGPRRHQTVEGNIVAKGGGVICGDITFFLNHCSLAASLCGRVNPAWKRVEVTMEEGECVLQSHPLPSFLSVQCWVRFSEEVSVLLC